MGKIGAEGEHCGLTENENKNDGKLKCGIFQKECRNKQNKALKVSKIVGLKSFSPFYCFYFHGFACMASLLTEQKKLELGNEGACHTREK